MGSASYRRGSENIRKQLDKKPTAQNDMRSEIALLTDQRDEARDLALERYSEIVRLSAQIKALQQQVSELETAQEKAAAKAQQSLDYLHSLWKTQAERADRITTKYHQLQAIVACGIKKEDFDIVKSEAQAYFRDIDWSDVDKLRS